MIIYLKRLKSSKFVRVKAFPMYGDIGVSAPSLHRESTDSLIMQVMPYVCYPLRESTQSKRKKDIQFPFCHNRKRCISMIVRILYKEAINYKFSE